MSVEYKFTRSDLRILREFLEEMKSVPDVSKMENMTSPWWKLFKMDEDQLKDYTKVFKHHRVYYRSWIGDVWYMEKEYVADLFVVCSMLQFGHTVHLTGSQCRSLLKIGVPCGNGE